MGEDNLTDQAMIPIIYKAKVVYIGCPNYDDQQSAECFYNLMIVLFALDIVEPSDTFLDDYVYV